MSIIELWPELHHSQMILMKLNVKITEILCNLFSYISLQTELISFDSLSIRLTNPTRLYKTQG